MATHINHIPIDRFGRVVLPKPMRDRLGVKPGTEFEVEETEDAIVLKPVVKKAKLVNKEGWLVFDVGEKELSEDSVLRAIDESRKERDEHILGMKIKAK